MPIRAYLSTSGASFSPETVAAMGKAFEDAAGILGIPPGDAAKREALAKFLIRLTQEDSGLAAATMRDKAVVALGGSIRAASAPKDGKPGAS
jgi:hypothetical protein